MINYFITKVGCYIGATPTLSRISSFRTLSFLVWPHIHLSIHISASISVMTKKIYDMLALPPLEQCYLDVHPADVARKKPLGKVNDVLVMVNNNFVPTDFVVLDIDCNASCPIILGRPFLRIVGVIIDMRDGIIRYQFPLKKGMEHFPRKIKKSAFYSIRSEERRVGKEC